ncbi:LCP family protein [Actinoallomurus spadix]|uniref:Cell envelope-related transcriptional attenuator domain-containing protein n=1 Tax=Actinoallomurus spadix TaxID=79912 RepID=A0ABP3GY18_9ACTN|nr:LCP family protein [Actinoallomurus spadix]MCO5986834.1 LCP family protein [Actinoallomurus spadix]
MARQVGGREPVPVAGLWRALGLTLASAVVWGVAHVAAGRRAAGFTLMGVLALLLGGAATLGLAFQEKLKQIAVQGTWLNVITVAILVLALAWAAIIIRSYQVVRPAGLPTAMRVASTTLVVVLSLLICTPFVYAANTTYVLRDTLAKIFPGDDTSGQKVNASDPWKGMPRVNVLLLGGDGGKDRTGIRTDSMTVASINTKTGDTVLLSLPRQLQKFQLPPRLRSRWPQGYTGDPGDQGLLNELYIEAQRHPELLPKYKKASQRGPHLLEEVIGYLLNIKIHYYVLVNLSGFKDIVNAMGGVTVHIEKKLPIGGEPERGIPPSGYLMPGTRHLTGEQALWYGRSRHADDDFHRMDRQKCLMRDIAQQADPQKVVTHFEKLAKAATNTIYTNIPSALLPALVKLSGTVKNGADIHSLPYNPAKIPGFHVYEPNVLIMRRAAARAIAQSDNPQQSKPTATVSATAKTNKRKTSRVSPSATATSSGSGAVSLKNVCG